MSKRLAALALLACTCGAHAATLCRLVATPGIAFGAYDTLSPVPTDTLTNIRVTCERNGGPRNVTLVLRLGAGTNGTSANNRRMRQVGGSGDFLGYGLYREVARTSIWGQTDNVDTVSQSLSVPNRATQSTTFTIYGRIPALQNVSVGIYGDSVAITLTP